MSKKKKLKRVMCTCGKALAEYRDFDGILKCLRCIHA